MAASPCKRMTCCARRTRSGEIWNRWAKYGAIPSHRWASERREITEESTVLRKAGAGQRV